MNRHAVTEQILAAKRARGLSFNDLAERTGADRVWLTSALLGQHPLPADLAGRVGEALELDDDAVEDFGDGIMSAITFNLALDRRETDAGPRVRITLDGKFLPYKWES